MKVNAYKIGYFIFSIINLILIGLDSYAFDSTDNLIFVIHGISIVLTFGLSILDSKIYAIIEPNCVKSKFSEFIIINIVNIIPLLNFVVLLFVIINTISIIINYIENNGNFTFKP